MTKELYIALCMGYVGDYGYIQDHQIDGQISEVKNSHGICDGCLSVYKKELAELMLRPPQEESELEAIVNS